MSGALPSQLAMAPNSQPLIMDGRNLAHRPGGKLGVAACGSLGVPVNLAQAIAWGVGYCRGAACYPSAQGGRPPRSGVRS